MNIEEEVLEKLTRELAKQAHHKADLLERRLINAESVIKNLDERLSKQETLTQSIDN